MAIMEERVTITIPAASLEDVRAGLVDQVECDKEALSTDQGALEAEPDDFRQADVDASVIILSRDSRLLSELLGETDDMTVTADQDTIGDMLQATVRVLDRRLSDACRYCPISMVDVLDLTARLRWAADEAIRAGRW